MLHWLNLSAVSKNEKNLSKPRILKACSRPNLPRLAIGTAEPMFIQQIRWIPLPIKSDGTSANVPVKFWCPYWNLFSLLYCNTVKSLLMSQVWVVSGGLPGPSCFCLCCRATIFLSWLTVFHLGSYFNN